MKTEFITPAITIFDKNGKVDMQGNRKFYDFLFEKGMDGILVMGSIGEFFSMTTEEKMAFIDMIADYAPDKDRFYIGTGSMTIEETVMLSNYAYDKGLKNVMVISPYYFTLSAESIELFYDKVAENTNANVYLYNFPDRTGYAIPHQVTLNLLRKHKNIVGYKDSVSQMGQTRELMRIVLPEFPNFKIYSGFDENLVHNAFSGGAGCIGGLSNIAPEICSAWTKSINDKNFAEIEKYQKMVNDLMAIYDVCTPFMPAMKKAIALRGLPVSEHCNAPFIAANAEQTAKIKEILQKANLI